MGSSSPLDGGFTKERRGADATRSGVEGLGDSMGKPRRGTPRPVHFPSAWQVKRTRAFRIGVLRQTAYRTLSCSPDASGSSDDRTALATAKARRGGTAFPTWRYFAD